MAIDYNVEYRFFLGHCLKLDFRILSKAGDPKISLYRLGTNQSGSEASGIPIKTGAGSPSRVLARMTERKGKHYRYELIPLLRIKHGDSENRLDQTISQIRLRLGDTPQEERFIKREEREGYLFVPDVDPVPGVDGLRAWMERGFAPKLERAAALRELEVLQAQKEAIANPTAVSGTINLGAGRPPIGMAGHLAPRKEASPLSVPAPAPARTHLSHYATVPQLPTTFFERPEISEPLREKIIGTEKIVAITAVQGMGGVGKTQLTIGLCHDPQVRQRFPDGIVWIDIVKENKISFRDRVRFIADKLSAEFDDYGAAEYNTLLENKSFLLVLDDVWTLSDVEPFRIGSGRSRLLFTSRNKELFGPLGAENQDVGEMEPDQARRFLNRWAGCENNPPPEPFATGILDQCKGLALGLAMMGAALRGQRDAEWERVLDDLVSARLKEVGKKPGGYAYQTLHAAIEVSVNALPVEDKARYLKLAFLPKDFSASPRLLRQLWGGDERSVRRAMRLFCDRSLARSDTQGIRLHDLQLDYVRGEDPHSEALALKRGALLLSAHVIQEHPEELGSQLTARLLANQGDPAITAFLEEMKETTSPPRLRPLWSALTPPGGPTERILAGHAGNVWAVAITPDGKRAISGSDDRTVRVWDLEGMQPARVLEGHGGGIWAVAITADGKRAISGSDDRTVRVWDLEGQQPVRVLEGHAKLISAVAISANGKRAISGSDDKTVRVWDLEGQQPTRVLEGHGGGIWAVAITADGKRAISGSTDTTVRVWDLEGQQPTRVLEGHEHVIKGVAISANGKRAISGSRDNTVRVWDLEGRQPARVLLEGHAGGVWAVAISANGKRAILGSDDKTVRVWDLEGQQPARVLEGHAGGILAVAITATGKRAISGSADKTVRVWDLEGEQPAWVLEGHAELIWAVAITPDGKRAIFGSDDNTVRVWDLESQQPARVLGGHAGGIWAVAINANGKRAISGSTDKTVRVWDLEGQQPARVLEGHAELISAVAISANGKRAISGSDDKTVRVWDLEGQQPARVLEGHGGGIWAVAITADGKRAISGSTDTTVRVWDLEGQQPTRVLEGHEHVIKGVAISANGKRAISGSADKTVRVWDLEGGQPARVLEGHADVIKAVAISANGKRAISGSADNTVRVWDLEGNVCLAQFTCEGHVCDCAIANERIVACDAAGHLHVLAWEE